jgi:L-asparaginase
MNINNKILIINTGGTFNKYYDPIAGELQVSQNNNFLEDITQKAKLSNIKIEGILYKDSLQINDKHREVLIQYIHKSSFEKIIVVHGTDTIDKSAKALDEVFGAYKTIVLTGAMEPYSIQSVEAVANLMMGYGYLLNTDKKGVFLSMHGMVEPYNKIYKNKELGIFECQS